MVEVMNNLYINFFELSKEEVDKYVDLVRSNIDYNSVEFITTYIKKFLPVLQFAYDIDVADDVVVKAILTGQVNNFRVMAHAISELNKEDLLAFYGDQLAGFTTMLDNMDLTDKERLSIFDIAVDDLVDGYAQTILEFILLDKNSKYISCLTEEDKDVIIEGVNNGIPEKLDDSSVNYILEHDEWTDYFVLNLYHSLRTLPYSDYTRELIIKKFNQLGLKELEDIPIDRCGELLNQAVNNNRMLDTYTLESIIRSIIRHELGNKDFQVYFLDLADSAGYEYSSQRAIGINIGIIDQYTKMRISGDLITLLEIAFHECTHLKQEHRLDNQEDTPETIELLKERLINDSYDSYYDENYEIMYSEQEAHLAEKVRTREFILKYITNGQALLDAYDYDESIAEEQEFDTSGKIIMGKKRDPEQVFEHLVYLKPSLITENKLLQKEYNLDGTKKDSGKGIVKK